MDYSPLVSCICPTYGRPPAYQHLLEETIESFLRQTYPNKELIVLNDCPGQELVCDAPGVRVVNVPERFATLGTKRNAGVELARGELIAPWDDGDISLPWRLSLSVERLGNADYFNPKHFWFMDRDELRPYPRSNIGHNLSLFRRASWAAVGGYPSISSDVDLALDTALRTYVTCVGHGIEGQGELTTSEIYYLDRANANHECVSAHPVQEGRVVLRPHWRRDYEMETRRLDEVQAALGILEATYGSGQNAVDVTMQLRTLVRNGRLSFIVSNDLFGDPCPNTPKTLRLTYERPADDGPHRYEAAEHETVALLLLDAPVPLEPASSAAG